MRAWIAGVLAGSTLGACSLTGDLSELQSGDAGGAAGSGAGANLCDPACQRAELADCPNDDGPTCRTDCKAQSATIPASCMSAWAQLLQCAASNGTYVCDAAGQAQLTNCAGAAQILEDCRSSGTGGDAGAGGVGGVAGAGSGGLVGGGSGGLVGGGSGGLVGGSGGLVGGSGGLVGGSGGVVGGGGSGNVGTCPFSPCQPAGATCGDNNECCSCDCKDAKCN